MSLNTHSLFTVLALSSVVPVSADRTSAPLLPPGQAVKVSRADFTERGEREKEREQRLRELELALELSAQEREARRLAIEAEKEAERQALAQAKAQAPEDFAGDARKVVLTEAPKVASVQETVVQQAAVVATAKRVIVRRSR